MRALPLLLLLTATSAGAQTFNPVADYVTEGQDEPGYRSWYLSSPENPIRVAGFHHYITHYGAGWIVPTWQLLRTASSWKRCGFAPYEVPPTSEWPHIVQTLRYVRDEIVLAIGPVEPVSGYRNPGLNVCAGGAKDSAHKGYYALDLVPLTATTREELIRVVCTVHYRRGKAYDSGLGFYSFLRFHVDSKGFREWGPDGKPESSPCIPIETELQPPETAKAVQQ